MSKRKPATAVERREMLELYCRGVLLDEIARKYSYRSRSAVLRSLNRDRISLWRSRAKNRTRDWLFV